MQRGLGQNYLWEKYPGEIFPENPAHTTSVGFVGVPKGVGQNYLWEKYPGEIYPETPAHTTSVGFVGTPKGLGECNAPCSAGALTQPPAELPDIQSAMYAAWANTHYSDPGPELPDVETPVAHAWSRLRGCGQSTPLPVVPASSAVDDTTATPSSGSTTTLIIGLISLAAGIGGLGWLAHQSVK
jgi:hypothetical protein